MDHGHNRHGERSEAIQAALAKRRAEAAFATPFPAKFTPVKKKRETNPIFLNDFKELILHSMQTTLICI